MGKAIGFVVLFVIFIIIKIIITGTKTALKAGKEAYNAVESGEGFESFKRGMSEGTPHAIIGMLTKVAKSDGRIDEYEAAVIQNTVDQLVEGLKNSGMDFKDVENYRNSLLKTFNSAKDDSYGITHYANKIDSKSDRDFMESIIGQLVMISFLEGLTSRKEVMVHEAAQILGVSRYFVDNLIDTIKQSAENEHPQTNKNAKDPWHVLGVNKNDSFDTIKKAYRTLVKKFHPDNIQSKGLDEEFMHFAKQRMQEINTAYEAIKKEHP